MIRLLPLLALVSCASVNTETHVWMDGKPDMVLQSGQRVFLNGQRGDARMPAVVVDLQRRGIAACSTRPIQIVEALDASWKNTEIDWEPVDPSGGFLCGNREVAGCEQMASPPGSSVGITVNVIEISSLGALPEEEGHIVWWTCFGRSGESPAGIMDADLAAWVAAARLAEGI